MEGCAAERKFRIAIYRVLELMPCLNDIPDSFNLADSRFDSDTRPRINNSVRYIAFLG